MSTQYFLFMSSCVHEAAYTRQVLQLNYKLNVERMLRRMLDRYYNQTKLNWTSSSCGAASWTSRHVWRGVGVCMCNRVLFIQYITLGWNIRLRVTQVLCNSQHLQLHQPDPFAPLSSVIPRFFFCLPLRGCDQTIPLFDKICILRTEKYCPRCWGLAQ